jgi:hypothetical protein
MSNESLAWSIDALKHLEKSQPSSAAWPCVNRRIATETAENTVTAEFIAANKAKLMG